MGKTWFTTSPDDRYFIYQAYGRWGAVAISGHEAWSVHDVPDGANPAWPDAVFSWSSFLREPLDRTPPAEQWFLCSELATGWPMLSMVGRADWRVVDRQTGRTEFRAIDGLFLSEMSDGFVPLRPIWRGFIVNTVLYTIVCFLLWTAGCRVVRWIFCRLRRRKGHCPKCDYDLRGSAESGCPECGWGRTVSGLHQ